MLALLNWLEFFSSRKHDHERNPKQHGFTMLFSALSQQPLQDIWTELRDFSRASGRNSVSSDMEQLTPEIVEQFLDKNQDFSKSYFEKNATSAMVDHWMLSRSHRPGSRGSMEVNRQSVKPSNRVKSLVGSVTNVKLKSIIGKNHVLRNLSQTQLESMDEKELFMELIRDIANELDINRLSHKILVNVSILTKADRCSLFLVRGKKENRELVSKLFDVTAASTLEESLRSEEDEIVVPFGVGIAGVAAENGEAINIKDAYSVS